MAPSPPTSAPRLILKARAKINLHLEVLGRLPNGYHAVETLLQSVELSDRLTVEERTPEAGVQVVCENPEVPTGPDNLIVRAAETFFRFTGRRVGLQVHLEKCIPVGAGLGGGSADAAATLVALNRLCGTHYPSSVLERIAAAVGADVPFLIRGGTQWATGVGTTLQRLPSIGRLPVLIAFPGVQTSTGTAYSALGLPPLPPGQSALTRRSGGDKILSEWVRVWISGRPTQRWKTTIRNRFEPIVFQEHPELEEVRDELIALGAVAHLTGSGSAVYGVFTSQGSLQRAWKALQGRFPVVIPTEFAERGVVIVREDLSHDGPRPCRDKERPPVASSRPMASRVGR